MLVIVLAVFSLSVSYSSLSPQLTTETKRNIELKVAEDIFGIVLEKEIKHNKVPVLLMDKKVNLFF